MNILVVDDELFFIEELTRLINKYREQTGNPVSVSRTAYSAEEALLILESGDAMPDAVFTDIRMASLDGLDLAKAIHNKWPELPVAIVSGYPSFHYAREALLAQVQDYILKPIDVPSLYDLLERLYEGYLDRQYEVRQTWLNRFLLLDKESLANEWIRSAPCRPDDLAVYLLRSPELAYAVEDWLIRNIGEEENNVWICGHSKRELVVFAEGNALRNLLSQTPFPVSVAAAEALDDWSRLRQTINMLSENLDQTAVFGRSAWVDNLAKPDGADGHSFPTLSPVLPALARKQDWAAMLNEARRTFNSWQTAELPVKKVQERLSSLIRLLAAESGQSDLDKANRTIERMAEDLQGSFSWEDAWTSLESALYSIIGQTEKNSSPDGGSAALFQHISSYLGLHYREPITAQSLAEQFHISRTTLYHLFREFGETTYIDYLTDIRMNKAKQLIKSNPSMKMKDIAECAGYSDHHYFSRAFKAATGLTPSEYRETASE